MSNYAMSADPPAGGAGWPYGRSTHTALMRMLHPSFGMASAARHLGEAKCYIFIISKKKLKLQYFDQGQSRGELTHGTGQ